MSAKFPKHRHDIKEDKFVTFVFKWSDYIQEHWKKFATGGGVIIVVIIVIIILVSQHNRQEQMALQEFATAMSFYSDENMNKADKKFKEIIRNYKSTRYGKWCNLYLGKICLAKDSIDYDLAQEYFAKAVRIKNDFLKEAAMLGVGKCYLGKGEKDKYYSQLIKITDKFPRFYKTPDYYFEIAEYYFGIDKLGEATNFYQKIVDKYKDSGVYQKAKGKLNEIKTANFEL